MAGDSKIEWTDSTWNPIAGCSVISPGCTNCYAMRTAARLAANPQTPHYHGTVQPSKAGPVWTGKIGIGNERILTAPLRWRNPRRVFVNSMSDLFHESIPDTEIDKVFAVMALAPQHTFQVLTKRAERMRQWFTFVDEGPSASRRADHVGLAMLAIAGTLPHGHRRVPWPLPNVWLGVSAERQEEWDKRTEYLRETPAAIRFVSVEPMLGPIKCGALSASKLIDDPGIDWIIVGGESGKNARPMHPDWPRSIREQCKAADVRFFFKQWGEYHPSAAHDPALCDPKVTPEAIHVSGKREWAPSERFAVIASKEPGWAGMCKVGKKRAGRLLDGREHNDFPPAAAYEAAA